MIAVEIILIVVGVACICGSFFISKKKESAGEDIEGGARGADIWTEKDEEVIIRHIDEILEKRGMELVETTEDQMNRICNEKIMAIDEFTKPLLDKINANHEEVVFMYNMLGEKQKEIRHEIEEDTKRKAVPVINPAPQVVSEEVLSRLQQVESEENEPVPDKNEGVPEATQENGRTGLERARDKMETIPGSPYSVGKNKQEGVPEVSTGQPIRPVDPVGTSRGNEIGSRRTVFSAHQYEPKITEPETIQESLPAQSITPIMPVETPKPKPKPAQIQAEPAMAPKAEFSSVISIDGNSVKRTGIERISGEPEPVSPAEKLKRPSRESFMQQMEEPSATSAGGEDISDKVRRMYKQGRSVVDISKELNMGQGEVKLMIAMYKNKR
ncbi:MAG: hypothetical protein J5819_05910 [Eubacterium sp.]|nr:hypothetical protein [Eubacterium sp.]